MNGVNGNVIWKRLKYKLISKKEKNTQINKKLKILNQTKNKNKIIKINNKKKKKNKKT